MATCIHITDDCRESAERHGLLEAVEKLEREARKSQSCLQFQGPSRIKKRKLRKTFRLFGYQYMVDGNEIIVCLKILKRDDRDYRQLLNDETFFKRKLDPPTDQAVHDLFKLQAESSPLALRKPPSANERTWLWSAGNSDVHSNRSGDIIALETGDWIEQIKTQIERGELGTYRRLLSKISQTIQGKDGFNVEKDGDSSEGTTGIAYYSNPSLNQVLLIQLVSRSTDVEAIKKKANNNSYQTDLIRHASRSYPLFTVLDDEAWNTIQRDREANLALSPEEAEILSSVGIGGEKYNESYPLFINGRAGSGKSTILQYLAADYVQLSLADRSLEPLYLTSGSELLERSKQIVRDIVRAHHANVLSPTTPGLEQLLKTSFRCFREFLLSSLPDEQRDQMIAQNYVGYSRFLRLWRGHVDRSHLMRRLSPDVSWHVIRSFIKGRRLDGSDEFDKLDYRDHDSKGRSVSEETFEQVFDLVWNGWYRNICKEQQLWDDQDLATVALEHLDKFPTNIGAVFCDEAQDFTALELRIISNLSVFSHRELTTEELARVPTIFAGDPLQTINPTGFRWDAVKADFHNDFRDNFDSQRRASVRYEELTYNYRSNMSIVKFCNLIQLFRCAALGRTSVAPQVSWALGRESIPVVRFLIDDPRTKQALREHVDFVKIVNCYEGEETEFVGQDQALSGIEEAADGVYRNFFSPMRAKGLEFSSVVLYGFGERVHDIFPKGLLTAIRNSEDLSDSQRIEVDHFFNRLYVAASRAREQLIVVDTTAGFEGFWDLTADQIAIDEAWHNVGWKGKADEVVELVSDGPVGAWKGEFVDPAEQGEAFRRQGRLTADSYLLRQASLSFRRADRSKDADLCLAEAAEADEKWTDAGQRFEELGEDSRAVDCYWRGEAWRRLSDLATGHRMIKTDTRVWAADVMRGELDSPSEVSKRFCRAAEDEDWLLTARSDGTWRSVFRRVAEDLARLPDSSRVDWKKLDRAFFRFDKSSMICSHSDLAEIAYLARNFKRAHELWRREKRHPEHDRFRRARSYCNAFPSNIEDLVALGEIDRMMDEWSKHGERIVSDRSLDAPDAERLVDAALEAEQLSVAVRILGLHSDEGRARKTLCSAIQGKDFENSCVMTGRMVADLVRTARWTEAMAVADGQDYSSILGTDEGRDIAAEFLKMRLGCVALYAAILEISNSNHLEVEEPEVQRTVSRVVCRHFLGKSSTIRRQMNQAKLQIGWQLVGSTLEQSKDFANAILHYARAEASAKSERERHLARQRKVVCREQFAETIEVSDRGRANQQNRLALRERESYGLAGVSISREPVRTSSGDNVESEVLKAASRLRVSGVQRKQSSVERKPSATASKDWRFDPFVIRWSPKHRKLRIEHLVRFESVSINKDGPMGDTKISKERRVGHSGRSWRLPLWNATVEVVSEDKMRIRLSVKGRDIFRETF